MFKPLFLLILILISIILALLVGLKLGKEKINVLTETKYLTISRESLGDPELFNAWDNTPMQDAKKHCSQASWFWGMTHEPFVAISFAESSWRNFNDYNPWGMMYNSKKLKFNSWHESCNKFAMMLKYNFFEYGYDEPAKMVDKYVAPETDEERTRWLQAVGMYWQPVFCNSSLKC